MIKLRPHHLLCLIGWSGNGYDRNFADNLNRIVAELEGGAGFEVVAGADDICAACPHADGASCRRSGAEKLVALDERVLFKLGPAAAPGDLASLKKAIAARVFPGDLPEICQGCSWLAYGWCERGLKELALTTSAETEGDA